jgi:hypothetical protein
MKHYYVSPSVDKPRETYVIVLIYLSVAKVTLFKI